MSGGTIPDWNGGTTYERGFIVKFTNGLTYISNAYAPSGYGPYGGYLDGTFNGIIYWRLYKSGPAKAQVVLYKKIVCFGLTNQTINFATAGSLGHRVLAVIPVDLMNQFFVWTRATGEVSPTGRFVNAPTALAASAIPTFDAALVAAFGSGFTDLDGVAAGLNFSSSALDMTGDLKRDTSIYNALTDTGLSLPTPVVNGIISTTHYSANDLVMAYLMFKCFGSSSYDTNEVIYNVDDAFGMLTSEELADAITASLNVEDALANACVLPNGKAVSAQLPGDNKGQVDSMFRAFLAADPLRYFLDGKQIPGLFETNFVALDASGADPSVGGNWCFTVGDKIEVPLQLVYTEAVNVLSVQDNVQNPSSTTPDDVRTNIIAGEKNYVQGTTPTNLSNAMKIRLQIVCGAPLGINTLSTSVPAGTPMVLKVAASASAIFYTATHHGEQTAIVAIAAGGTRAYAYSYTPAIPNLTMNLSTGLLTYTPNPSQTLGVTRITVSITDSASPTGNVLQDVNVTFDRGSEV